MNPFSTPSRRDALRLLSSGFGMLALKGVAAAGSPVAAGGRLPARAKRVIFLCMTGAPSHVDTFDHKPMLTKRDGASLSGFRRGAKLMGSPWAFKPGGKSGLMISELLPEIGKQADHLCLLHGMHTDVPAHAQATTKLHTGSFQFVRPSMGAWTLYGLGTENENLPGFVTLNPPRNQGGAQNYGSSFLPATFQGMPIRVSSGGQRGRQAKDPVSDIRNPRQSDEQQRAQLDLLRKLNETNAKRRRGSDEIDAVIQSYELAFRMQSELPELLDITKE